MAVNAWFPIPSNITLVQTQTDRKRRKAGADTLDRAVKISKGVMVRVTEIDTDAKLVRVYVLDGPKKGFVG